MKFETFADYAEDVEKFEKYLQEKHPQLPKNINKILLSRFLKTCDRDFEETAKLIKVNFNFRSKHENLFVHRDFFDEKSIDARKVLSFHDLPGRTKSGAKLVLFKFINSDVSKLDIGEVLKLNYMAMDINKTMDVEIPEYEIGIIDGNGMTFRHIMKVIGALFGIKTYLDFVQDGIPYYLKSIHVVNVSSVVKYCYSLIQPFIRNKLPVYFHDSHEQLFDLFDKHHFPEEYGGTGGTLEQMRNDYFQMLEENVKNLKFEF